MIRPGSTPRTGGGRPAGVVIAGTGVCLPEKTLTNADLTQLVETDDAWITQRTGIQQRRVADDGLTLRGLAGQALQDALADAKLPAEELDLVLLATITPEMACPSAAARIAAEVGAAGAGAFDLAAACAGWVYGLNLATAMLETGQYRHAAVIGAELLTRQVDFSDRRTCILFGDGAGAAVLSATDRPGAGSLAQTMRSDGRHWQDLYLPLQESHVPEGAAKDHYNGSLGTLQMNGREVFKVAVQATQGIIDETLETAGVAPDELSMVIAHQSNARILEATRKRLGLPAEKLYINIDRFGNTSAASVPIALHELRQAGRLTQDDLVLFTAVGGGMCWCSNLWRL